MDIPHRAGRLWLAGLGALWSRRPRASNWRYTASIRSVVSVRSGTAPRCGLRCSRMFLGYEAIVDAPSRSPAAHSSRYSPVGRRAYIRAHAPTLRPGLVRRSAHYDLQTNGSASRTRSGPLGVSQVRLQSLRDRVRRRDSARAGHGAEHAPRAADGTGV